MLSIKTEKTLLSLGLVSVVIYLANLLILASMYPEYSHLSNFVSDLGRIEAPHHQIFNVVIFSLGILYLATAVGFYSSMQRITNRKTLSLFVAIFIGSFGINLFFGGLFPLPDTRHAGYGIGSLHFFTPLLLIWILSKVPGTRSFKMIQVVSFTGMFLASILSGLAIGQVDLVQYLGLFQRIQAVAVLSWYTFTCYWLMKKSAG